MKIIKHFHPKFLSLFLLIYIPISIPSLIDASLQKQKSQTVLVVNSYHPGYSWSDDIMLGIQDVLSTQRDVDLIIEHLDTKRHFEKPYFRQMEELFRHKYRSSDIDAVITSDDNALNFILSIRKKLFPDAPLIFCGIDHITPERFANQESVYGIEEADSTSSTIKLILSIHPEIESITFITDETSTGQLMLEKTKELEPAFQKDVRFDYIIGVPVEKLQLTLKGISENTVIFYLSFIRDKNGEVFSIEDSMKLIAENANVPVYCSWGFQPDTGVIGGNVLSGYKQGEISAEIAGRLLGSDPVKGIPAIQQAPLVSKFDYKALNRFNIDKSRIPQNSIIYNKPKSFYANHKMIIWSTLSVGFSLVFLIILLFINIGRRKKTESDLQKANEGLEQNVNDRTRHLSEANRKLHLEITDRKQAEEALRDREEFLNSIFTQSPFASWISDEKGTLQRANPALKGFLNLTDEQLVGKYNVLEDPVTERQGLQPLFRTVFEEGKVINFNCEWDGNDIPNLNLNGSNSVLVEGTMFPIHNPEGKLTNVVLQWIDITERKHAEEEKENLEAQLRQSHKMEAIGTLAGGIAHEFNNILGIIVGNTELAMGGVPEWNTAHYNLEEIQKGSLRARDIVKQILAFSRQTKHELKPVKICSLIDESINFIRSSIPTTVEIKKDISAEFDTINADPTQINQILLNLCNNAAHAMQDKGGVMEISLENVELDENAVNNYVGLRTGNHVKLTVSDTGHGIEKENREHIFDPFFTTKEVGKGTGMGLSVVHGIVKEHNGSIMVQSETGKGTAFHVLFPVIESSVKPELDSKEPLLKGSERILFVDDEESLVLAAKKNLEDMGYEVVTKRSPVKALEMFKEQPDEFDLVITDMAMPDLPGDRFAAEIMKIRRDVPVIACTGYSDRMDGELAEEMGIRAYIMKPYLASELATIIRLALDQGKEEKTHEKGKILVVDDEEQMRSIIRQMLESAGYDVMEAPDGKVALWLFKEKPADLIISDIIMPEKEGLETIMELKRELPDVKIIAISGGGQGDAGQYLDMAKKMGANSTLAKPFEKEELLKAVKDLLG